MRHDDPQTANDTHGTVGQHMHCRSRAFEEEAAAEAQKALCNYGALLSSQAELLVRSGKLGAEGQKSIGDLVDKSVAWLQSNQKATAADYEAKLRGMQGAVQPILLAGSHHRRDPQPTAGAGAQATTGPIISEVD